MTELKCKKCGSGGIYTLADKTIVCKKCGHRKKGDEDEHKTTKQVL